MADVLKETKEKVTPCMTRREATRGKKVLLHRLHKGMIALTRNAEQRGAFKRLMLDAESTVLEQRFKKSDRKTDTE